MFRSAVPGVGSILIPAALLNIPNLGTYPMASGELLATRGTDINRLAPLSTLVNQPLFRDATVGASRLAGIEQVSSRYVP